MWFCPWDGTLLKATLSCIRTLCHVHVYNTDPPARSNPTSIATTWRAQVEKSAIETNFLCPVCPYKHCITKKYKSLVLTTKKTEDDVVNGPKVGGCPRLRACPLAVYPNDTSYDLPALGLGKC